jgi:2-polyprenyl-6-methoxyphenol hydroxylase-like FAD-dependent oxidoreductase
MAKDLPVLVAGGGIGGLAAALALGRKGLEVRVFEQGSEFKEIGAGIQLGPNVYRMFDLLGLTEAIEGYSVHPDNMVMMDGLTGEEVIRLPVGGAAFRKRFGGYLYGVIHRADLHQVFLDACKREKNVELNVLAKALRFEQDGDRVTLHMEDGRRVEGCALVGADGLWSRVRNQLFGDAKPRVSGHIAYRAVLPRAEVPPDLWQNNVVLWAGPKTHLVHYPLRRGELYNLVAVFHSDKYEEGWNVYGDPQELEQKFSSERPEVRRLLAKINAWTMWAPRAPRGGRPPAAASRCWATPRTRRCSTWRRARTWRSRTRWCSPPTSSSPEATGRRRCAGTRTSAICALRGCRSPRATTATCTTPRAWCASCATSSSPRSPMRIPPIPASRASPGSTTASGCRPRRGTEAQGFLT